MVVSDGDGHARFTTDAHQDAKIEALDRALTKHDAECRERQTAVWAQFDRVHERIDGLQTTLHGEFRKLFWLVGGATLLVLAGEAGIVGVIKGLIGV